MTNADGFDRNDATLPGLEPASAHDTPLERATRQTIRALEDAGRLEPAHAVVTRLMLDLAAAIAAGARAGKASAVAMAGAQLLACYQVLVPPDDAGDTDPFAALLDDLRALEERDPTSSDRP